MPTALLHFTRRQAPPWVAALFLAGCTNLAPRHETPALPVPAQYATQDASANAGPGDAARIGWRDYFTEPAMQALIEQALVHNRDLRLAVLRVDEARAAFAIRRGEQSPSVGVQGDAGRSRISADLAPSGSAVVGNQFQLAVGLASWEIDFWGAVRNRNEAALQAYLSTDAVRRAATLALIAQVADGYVGLCELDERIALARQTVASRARSERIYSRRFEVGSSSRLNLIQVQTLLTQAQSLQAQLSQARAAQAHALTLLVGAPTPQPAAGPACAASGAMPALRAGLPSELLQHRPDIQAAEHRLRASSADIGSARAAFFPRVSLTGSLGTASGELDRLFAADTRAWSFGPSVRLPLFDGGVRQAGLDAATVRRELAVAQYDKTVQTAFRDVADALSARRWLREQLDLARQLLATQQERARLAQLRFDAGATSFLEVLDAQRDLLAAGQQQVQSRRAVLSNQITLYAALGGGTLSTPEDAALAPATTLTPTP